MTQVQWLDRFYVKLKWPLQRRHTFAAGPHTQPTQKEKEKSLKSHFFTKIVDGQKFRWMASESGEVYFGVRALAKDRSESELGMVKRIFVEKKSRNIKAVREVDQVRPDLSFASPKVVLLSPVSGTAASSRNDQISIGFSWTPLALATSYTLELSKDPNFSTSINKYTSEEGSFIVEKITLKGRLYWRVKPEIPGNSSVWSEPFYLDIN